MMKKIISWVLQVLAAVILLQTLYFKFSAHPESVELFSKLHAEPWGRIGTGIIELITSLLLLIPATKIIGALMGAGTMAGAILAHVMVIGIESKGDGGQLFFLAILVLMSCLTILLLNYKDALTLKEKLFKRA